MGLRYFFYFSWLLVLVACSPVKPLSSESVQAAMRTPVGQVVSTAFGPDNRLWRLVPTEEYVFVDYSTDFGKTFSWPVAVNQAPQKIRARAEDRPSIAIDGQGRIFVIYFADSSKPWSTFFSYSADDGQTFQSPELVSDQAESANHYQDLLTIGPSGRRYIFWHDERDGKAQGKVSLFYEVCEISDFRQQPDKKIMDSVCDCCRTAVDFDSTGLPVMLKRFIYPGSIRDHGIVKMAADGTWSSWRVTFDEWKIEACPEHGPALSIAPNNRYHIAWFSNGMKHKGLFYAHSDDDGKIFSKALRFGDFTRLASHADILSLGDRVALVWREFDGETTQVRLIQSDDNGESWSNPKDLARSKSGTDHPLLKSDGQSVYLSWNTVDGGYQLISIQ